MFASWFSQHVINNIQAKILTVVTKYPTKHGKYIFLSLNM